MAILTNVIVELMRRVLPPVTPFHHHIILRASRASHESPRVEWIIIIFIAPGAEMLFDTRRHSNACVSYGLEIADVEMS
jgi:hypothetical protein